MAQVNLFWILDFGFWIAPMAQVRIFYCFMSIYLSERTVKYSNGHIG